MPHALILADAPALRQGRHRRTEATGPALWWSADLLLSIAVYLVVALMYLWVVEGVDRQQILTGEEASVSFVDVVGVSRRFQFTHYSTNFAGHVFYWVVSHVDPSFDLFYGRPWKALAMALLAALAYLALRRRLGCSYPAAVVGALTAAMLPGVLSFAWLATENGLEAVVGMFGLLIATSRRPGWWVAPLFGAVSISAYGAGLAWAAVIGLVCLCRFLGRTDGRLRLLGQLGAATLAAIGIVVFPLYWWHGGAIVAGGGHLGVQSALSSLGALAGELFRAGHSYYYWTSLPALGPLYVSVLGLGGLVSGWMSNRAVLPWFAVGVLTVGLYAVSGGVPGVRRVIAIPVIVALGVGIAIDRIGAAIARLGVSGIVGGLTATAVGVAVFAPLGLAGRSLRVDLASSRDQLPVDFVFPIPPGSTMPQTVQAVARQAADGVPWVAIAHHRDGARTAALVYLLQQHGALPSADVTGATVEALYRDGPRCESSCHRVPAVQ